MFVSSGGTTFGVTLNQQGYEDVDISGFASGTTINSGGLQILNGGIAIGTTINGDGEQIVDYNASINGQVRYFYGSALSTTISNGGLQYVTNNGTAIGTTVSSGGLQEVVNQGIASGTTISYINETRSSTRTSCLQTTATVSPTQDSSGVDNGA